MMSESGYKATSAVPLSAPAPEGLLSPKVVEKLGYVMGIVRERA